MLKRLGISSKMYEFLYIEEQRWKIADICLQFKAASCAGAPFIRFSFVYQGYTVWYIASCIT